MKATFKLLFLFLLATVYAMPLLAQQQDLSGTDLSKIKVEELTDKQVQQFIQRADDSGMTMQQLETVALSRGMPPAEIAKLRSRIREIQNSTNVEENKSISRVRDEINTSQTEKFDIFNSLQSETADSLLTDEEKKRKRIFGYELFNTESLTFAPVMNLPTPKNYVIGPGDELIIDVWGASQNNYRLTVSPEGNIFIDNLGPVYVNGMTIEQASEKIISRLGSIYSGLRGNYPNTWANVSIGNVRSIQVTIVGEARLPGTYTLSSLSTVFNALYMSGGPSLNGSFRNVQLIRDNEIYKTIDIYDFLTRGEIANNVRLQDQDIIRIISYVARVDISGEVKRPAIFEITESEPFSEVINYAGGFTDMAYSHRLRVYRKTSRERRIIDVENQAFSDLLLQDGDSIPVGKILPRFENRVSVEGAVFREGDYQLTEGMLVSDLLTKAEGLRGDAYLDRATLYRTNPDYTIEAVPVSLAPDEFTDVQLQKDDLLKVSSIFELREEYIFEISGAVQNPGKYPYIEGATVEGFILMAGGLKESASAAQIEVSRRVKINDGSNSNALSEIYTFGIEDDLSLEMDAQRFVLQPFDRVFIRKSPNYEPQQEVVIQGEVMYPGNYAIKSNNERLTDLIERAGGFTSEAYVPGARLIRRMTMDEQRKRTLENISRQLDDTLNTAIEENKTEPIGISLQEILENPNSPNNLLLQKGDRLIIPKELQTVTLSGALLYPNTTRYTQTKGLRSYIASAGGFAENARKSKTFVIYPNGTVDRTHNLWFINKYPKIEPGTEIVVPVKPEKEGLTTQQAISITTALSSLALVVVTLVNATK